MYITVYVDNETFHDLVIEGKYFDACLNAEGQATISVLVPVENVMTSMEEDMVTVRPN